MCSEAAARAFVVEHHYSHSFPAARLRYGLYDGVALVGVAVLSVPVQKAVLTAVFPGCIPYMESLELGRFVLTDAVPANAESWFLSRALAHAKREHGLRGVVSFSDPLPRQTLDGQVVMPGHWGVVYQASNARYTGRGTPRMLHLLPDGTVLSARTIQKVRAGERGSDGAEAMLRRYGAPRRESGEQGTAWLHRALQGIGVRRVSHPGNLRYAFSLDRRRTLVSFPALPYPKRDAAVTVEEATIEEPTKECPRGVGAPGDVAPKEVDSLMQSQSSYAPSCMVDPSGWALA